ncbi:hypothetical protein AKJ16_DCAP00885 [Drosera capensis]
MGNKRLDRILEGSFPHELRLVEEGSLEACYILRVLSCRPPSDKKIDELLTPRLEIGKEKESSDLLQALTKA